MKVQFKITPLGPKGDPMHRVLHVEFDNRYDMAMTFVRMQEWYESPKFHHKMFTLEEFMRWYSKEYGKGVFTYTKDWSGFNIPSTAVLAVMNGPIVPYTHPQYHGPKYMVREGGWESTWSNFEEKLFDALVERDLIIEPDPTSRDTDWELYKAREPFYLIATVKESDPANLKHEAAHGKFFVVPEYRRTVLRSLKRHNTKSLATKLLAMGYSKWTMDDEIHAYALTGYPDGFRPTRSLRALSRDLKAIP